VLLLHSFWERWRRQKNREGEREESQRWWEEETKLGLFFVRESELWYWREERKNWKLIPSNTVCKLRYLDYSLSICKTWKRIQNESNTSLFFCLVQYFLPSRTSLCWARLCWACSILTQIDPTMHSNKGGKIDSKICLKEVWNLSCSTHRILL
jgi:hypothetical protein